MRLVHIPFAPSFLPHAPRLPPIRATAASNLCHCRGLSPCADSFFPRPALLLRRLLLLLNCLSSLASSHYFHTCSSPWPLSAPSTIEGLRQPAQ